MIIYKIHKLAIHVGLATSSKVIILEQTGKNKGYRERDITGRCPEANCCIMDGANRLDSAINMKTLCRQLSQLESDVIFSRDAGRYLCDYVYYVSLYCGNGMAAFIHVPPLSKALTANFLGRVLQKIIQEMLLQLQEILCETQ
ncbi:pyroglutamyl-peptidase 1-like protein isoform X2 [Protopterus annectens]|uniref:pyroglutamyl-peptidase 1-like protein isoform X2 n=1 Tax=Protopterus annectens TaxID=7888 RepID=UPI001CF9A9D5|nr:pyroglutamyl-peptidase 1-like protein isoform X2 [Protopterus annectens]